jgi:hypothetical protein
MKTRKDIEMELITKQRRIIAWERTHMLPDITELYNKAEVGT